VTAIDIAPAVGAALLAPETWSTRVFAADGVVARLEHEIREPATGGLLGTFRGVEAPQVRIAATAAAAAQVAWEHTAPEERAAVLRRAGTLFEEHAEEIQAWVQRETGAIAPKAELETHIAAQECFEASALTTAPMGDVLASAEPRWSFARRRAAGVVSVISPFNFPLILSIR